MILKGSLAVVSTDLFNWYPVDKSFTAEASSLPRFHDMFHQIYDDACDAGFILKSARTGTELVAYFKEQVKDADGDTRCWVFEAAYGEHDAKDYYTITVFND